MKYIGLFVLFCAFKANAETPYEAYTLLVGCSIAYAKTHPSQKLTATELAEAAVESCDSYTRRVREAAYQRSMSDIEKKLTPQQREALADEIIRKVNKNADDIRSDAIEKAKREVLAAIAESK